MDFSRPRPLLPVKLHCAELLAVYLIRADRAVAQADNAVGHALYGVVMRNKDNGVAVFFVHALDEVEYLLGGLVVKRARRLVAQQDVGVFDYRPADGGALLLAAGKLRGHLVPVLPQAERFEDILRRQGLVGKIRADLDVFLDRQVRDEVIRLENIAQVLAAIQRKLPLAHRGDLLSADADAARVGRFDAADYIQKRRFAGA